MKRGRAARAAPKRFALDRERLAAATRADFGELEGIDANSEDSIATALSRRFGDAREAEAISGPAGVEVIVYAIEDSVIVAVREEELPFDLPVALRQLASYSFETKYVFSPEDASFGEACDAIEGLLDRANDLLPSFAALQRGERDLGRDGQRRRLWRLRRLAAAAVP